MSQSVARVKAWLVDNAERRMEIAGETGLNEKTLRLAIATPKWDPRASTVEKLEALVPGNFKVPPTAKPKRSA